jgi:serine/threonine protein kinase
MVGTLQYMSPEQVRGRETDARSDIYSLGVLLFDLVTGRVPFQSKNDYELMHAHIEKPPPSPRDFAADLPEELERAVLRALAKSPDDRFATTAEFKVALDECELASIAEPVPPPTPAQHPDVERANGREAEATRLMVEGETSEASTIDRSRPTQIDTTLLDQPSPRLREIFAAARNHHVWAAAVLLALLLGINLLIFGRTSGTETRGPSDFDKARVSTAIPEASTRAPSDSESDSQAALETLETAARKVLGPERPPARVNSEIGSILPAARPAEPPPSLAAGATSRKPAPSPAEAAPNARDAKIPPQPSESTGDHGWIIER